jgi:biotin-(acetyl-CoA carboxylase) ligase
MKILGIFLILDVERSSIPETILSELERKFKDYHDSHLNEHLINPWSEGEASADTKVWISEARKECKKISPDCFYIRLR